MNNWKLTAYITLLFVLFSTISFFILGFNEQSLLLMLRISARTAIIIFLFAFLASTLIKIKKSTFTKWLLKNRRYIGVSFAIIHIIHLGFVFTRHFLYQPTLLITEPVSRVTGFIAYLFILIMFITSFDSYAKKISVKSWSLIHTVGAYYIWFIFFMGYVKRLSSGRKETEFYILFTLLLTALVVKITLKLKLKANK